MEIGGSYIKIGDFGEGTISGVSRNFPKGGALPFFATSYPVMLQNVHFLGRTLPQKPIFILRKGGLAPPLETPNFHWGAHAPPLGYGPDSRLYMYYVHIFQKWLFCTFSNMQNKENSLPITLCFPIGT